ncbi:9432_t:CDS:1 [Paraglomus brasilianum]|uniref:9432_t:CDS:1 n=1 Tax=Paraglomus brasilianum TaxID=144538 RepID=A0A9N9CP70_9GLOM|nr:9432_t:CDS:1 [Paraglomus brasilianum]
MKSAYVLLLLAVLIFISSTPANANFHRCVFKKRDNPLNLPTSPSGIPGGLNAGYNRNTFNGILEFVENANKLHIGGFIDIHDAITDGPVESVYDIHVAPCSTKTSRTPGDNDVIDLDDQSFATPIVKTLNAPLPKLNPTIHCCFVVEEFAFNNGGGKQRIYGIAKLEKVF